MSLTSYKHFMLMKIRVFEKGVGNKRLGKGRVNYISQELMQVFLFFPILLELFLSGLLTVWLVSYILFTRFTTYQYTRKYI